MILQSPPVWWSGLKGCSPLNHVRDISVSTCVVEWIERPSLYISTPMIPASPPVWWSGLKVILNLPPDASNLSPPVWWSGLKGHYNNILRKSDKSPPVWWSGLNDKKV